MSKKETKLELSLPAWPTIKLWLKRVGLILLAVLIIVLVAWLFVFGQWRSAKRLFFDLIVKWKTADIEKLDAQRAENTDKIARSKELAEALDRKFKNLEKEKAEAMLRAEGMTLDEVANELGRRGF